MWAPDNRLAPFQVTTQILDALRSGQSTHPWLSPLATHLSRLDIDQIQHLSRYCRHGLEPIDLRTCAPAGAMLKTPNGWALAAMLSFHGSGYVREQATRWLAAKSIPEVLPFLILRMNDWTPVVRAVALEAMDRRLAQPWAPALLKHLGSLLALKRWKRVNHKPFWQRLIRFLGAPEQLEDVIRSLDTSDTESRRQLYPLALSAAPHRGLELIQRAIAERDARLRRWAIKELIKHPEWCSTALLAPLLLDEALVIRGEAQRMQHQADGTFDQAALYREKINEGGPALRAALFGLGESGGSEEAVHIAPFLQHETTSIQRAALYGLAYCDLDNQAEMVIALVASPRRRVSNDATNQLIRSPHLVVAHRALIEGLLTADAPSFVRTNAELALEAGDAYTERWLS